MIYYINSTVVRQYFVTTPISCIFSSTELVKTLKNVGIYTLEDMIRMGFDVIYPIAILWKLNEDDCTCIKDFLLHLWSDPKGFPLSPTSKATLDFLDAEHANLIFTTPIEALNLSVKINNALIRSGIFSVEDLENTGITQLNHIEGLGKVHIDQIHNSLRTFVHMKFDPQNIDPHTSPAEKSCISFLHRMSKYFPCLSLQVYREILPFFSDVEKELDINAIYNTVAFRSVIQKKILSMISETPFGISFHSLRASFPEEILPLQILNNLLTELNANGRIEVGQFIRLRYMTAVQYITKNISNARLQDILIQRIQSASLNDVSQKYNISKERIRQLTSNWYSNKDILLYEDRYVPIFKKYYLKKKTFLFLFDETEETYNYLNMVISKKGQLSFTKICSDDTIPENIRQILSEKIENKPTVILDGKELLKQKRTLIEYLAFKYFKNGGTVKELSHAYQELLRNSNLDKDPDLIIDQRIVYERQLAASAFILNRPGCQFRYYDIWGHDYSRLLQELCLNQYQNIEYSTRRLFADHSDIMKEYDIIDEYELHNLLRKINTKYKFNNVRFRHTPNIVFGSANPTEQFYQILTAHSPISKSAAVALYEKKYGIKLARNSKILAPLEKYFDGHVYRL